MAAQDGAGERRRTRSLGERKRIVEEALAPGVSVAAVARRHGLNANLVFKWIRRSREGWRDRRREPAKEKPVVVAPPEGDGPAFVPVKLLELDTPSAPPPSDVMAKPARQTRRGARRGAMVRQSGQIRPGVPTTIKRRRFGMRRPWQGRVRQEPVTGSTFIRSGIPAIAGAATPIPFAAGVALRGTGPFSTSGILSPVGVRSHIRPAFPAVASRSGIRNARRRRQVTMAPCGTMPVVA